MQLEELKISQECLKCLKRYKIEIDGKKKRISTIEELTKIKFDDLFKSYGINKKRMKEIEKALTQFKVHLNYEDYYILNWNEIISFIPYPINLLIFINNDYSYNLEDKFKKVTTKNLKNYFYYIEEFKILDEIFKYINSFKLEDNKSYIFDDVLRYREKYFTNISNIFDLTKITEFVDINLEEKIGRKDISILILAYFKDKKDIQKSAEEFYKYNNKENFSKYYSFYLIKKYLNKFKINLVIEKRKQEKSDLIERIKKRNKLNEIIDEASKNYKIEELKLDTRTNNALLRSGIRNLYDLLNTSDEDLLKIRNFGQKCLIRLKEKLKEIGIEKNI